MKRIAFGVNKTDCDTTADKQARYDEIPNEARSMQFGVAIACTTKEFYTVRWRCRSAGWRS